MRPKPSQPAVALTAETIRRIAAELAHAAFEQEIELDIPWTDYLGRQHAKTKGRPVAMHAMRGISAHSNGFHTCRTIHLSADHARHHRCARRHALQTTIPKSHSTTCETRRKAGAGAAQQTFARPASGFCQRA